MIKILIFRVKGTQKTSINKKKYNLDNIVVDLSIVSYQIKQVGPPN